ncbi:protein SHORTAGE IN CHIASMATA 1 isoform X2 [Capsella rubella]|uniref:protein SHORTAGE IN CHIASMATA 1 isoform X2 n=1 Tax=Capsella rubella TaxID=81985 RepID=UPI000CD5A394|nr:protein SHORTAGE IN CHIASMATA 1 isoform X2 [Capsella rubella]
MRTRFLNIDYFSTPPSQVFETLGFLNLPAPDNFPAPLVCDGVEERLRFSSIENVCIPIGNLPIEAALSKFLSDVVPDRVSVDYEVFEIDDSSLGDYLSDKNDGDAIEEKATLNFIQLETPELDFETENKLLSTSEDHLQCFSEVLELENEPVKYDGSDIILQNSKEIQEQIYSVDYIPSDYFTENDTSVAENECFRKNQPWFKDFRFPLLEVDEVNLSELSSLSALDKVFTVLETIETQDTNAGSSLIINSKELIGSKDYAILDILSTDCYLNKSGQSDVVPEDEFSIMDVVTILEISNAEENFQFEQQGKVAVPVTFEEFQILDVEIYEVFDIFLGLQKAIEPEICYGMFSKEMNFKNFDELVVSSELAFTDDAFKSLPTPILHDYEMIRSLDLIYEDVLSKIKPQSLSASNDIYLPWNLLEERNHNHCDYPFEEIVTCNIDFNWESSEGDKWVYDFIFSEDAFCEPLVEKCTEPFFGISTLNEHAPLDTSHGSVKSPFRNTGARNCGGDDNAKKATLLFKSMSAFDDLTFFMDPQKAMIEDNLDSRVQADKSANHKFMSTDSKAPCLSGGMHPNPQTEEMILHSVCPSENILALVGDFVRSYLTLVKDESANLSEDKLKLLSISKGKLIDSIRKANVRKTQVADDKSFMFALLVAIKQMTWYMCFFGIHVAYLYLNKLCRSSVPMKLGLHTLYSAVETEHKSDETNVTRSHPSLAVMQGILQSEFSRGNSKALLLAEKVFWSSVKRLLMSMGLSYSELNSPSPSDNRPNVHEAPGFKTIELGSLPFSDCLIISYEQISPSFPVENFSVIVEYGGPNASPRFSFPSKLDSFPCFHFIKLELDMSSACGQLCAGVTVPYTLKMTKGDEVETKTGWLEELLNFVPLENVCYAGSSETTNESEFISMPQESERKSGKIEPEFLTDQKSVIVVNTKTVDKEMIISRRSTYQKVLAMEKEGVQVVERDSDLPVDLMLSPAVCLLWYDCEYVSKKSTATIGTSSSSLSWIGDIATDVLTSLSFSFSSCIMLFEGEPTFLATIMDSSDELYAAAGSLGISLQLFFSSSADLTDEVILRCIKFSVKLSKLHVKMSESESLAESFLTKCPSVNPLTAQVILSSSGSLLEFMKLPHSSKVERMQKYHVPVESVDLFSSLCRYGAREDSKSVMTDSSSSVSSGPDSDTHHVSVHSGSKKNHHRAGKNRIDMDDLIHFSPSTECADTQLKPSGDFQLDDSWSSRDHEIFDFDPVTEFDDAPFKPSGIIHHSDSWPVKDPARFDKKSGPGSSSKDPFWEKDLPDFSVEDSLPGIPELEDWSFPSKDEFRSQNRGFKLPVMGNFNLHDNRNSESFVADYKGEVIDGADKFLEEEFPPSPGYNRFAPIVSDVDEDELPRKSKSTRKLSFFGSLQPNFPKAADIDSSSERFAPEKDLKYDNNASLRGFVDNYPAKRQRTLLEEVLTRRSAVPTSDLPFREEISHFGGSPLSNAIHSSNPVQGSPWTIEFLNRVRERSRSRKEQQSLPSYVPPSSLETPGNIKKASTKRKSPSILEFFKYKGGNKLQAEKKQKRSKNSSASPKTDRFYSPLKSCTPIDKRAKQSLSFSGNGTGGQTKLVWK